MKQSSIILAALAMGVAACAFLLNSGFAAISDTPRCPENIICLEQGWSDSERSWWYSVSQGSRLLPLSWFLVLEQADSNEKFLSETNLRRLNYLPGYRSADNPYGLPLGFAVDKEEGGWNSCNVRNFSDRLCPRIHARTVGRDELLGVSHGADILPGQSRSH